MKKLLLLTLLLCLFATPCYANAGIPVFMFFPVVVSAIVFGFTIPAVHYRFNFLSFIPFLGAFLGQIILLWIVVLTEYIYLRQHLPKINPEQLKKQIWIGNIVTMILGIFLWIPFFWQYNQAAYIIFGPVSFLPYDCDADDLLCQDNFLYLSIALLIPLFVMCYFISYKLEAVFVNKIKGEYSKQEVVYAVKKANRRSYWTLLLCGLIWISIPFVLKKRLDKKKEIEKELSSPK